MTHFASAADYTTSQTDDQLAYFHAIGGPAARGRRERARTCTLRAPSPWAMGAPKAGTTWCAPATRCTATFRRRAATRRRKLLEVKPALTWKAKLLAVKEVPEGALIGYGGTFRAPRAMRIGVLGAGYADGDVPPAVEPRQGDRRRQAHADPRHHFDGPHHHRPEPHHGARPRATK